MEKIEVITPVVAKQWPMHEGNVTPPLLIKQEAGIVQSLEEFITDYASIPQSHYALPIALWALATHCYQKFDAFGYLIFTSDGPGSGKTRMLEILECVCHEGKLRSKITLAGMCSLIEKYQPTLLIDQGERLSQNEHNDMMACILSGYRPGLPVTIQQKSDAVDREIYCPKAFALLGDMIEAARDRSIVIPMRAMKTRKRWYRKEAQGRGERIIKRCKSLASERMDDIEDAIANFEGLQFLMEREDEIFSPVFIMCDLFCPERRTELERAAADICGGKRAEPRRISSRVGKVSADAVRDGERAERDLLMLCDRENGIRTNEALRRMKAIHNAPWNNYAGVGLTDIKLAELVRPYGVAPRQFKKDGKNLRGYTRCDLMASLVEHFGNGLTNPLPRYQPCQTWPETGEHDSGNG